MRGHRWKREYCTLVRPDLRQLLTGATCELEQLYKCACGFSQDTSELRLAGDWRNVRPVSEGTCISSRIRI